MKTERRLLIASLMVGLALASQAASRYVAQNGQVPEAPYTNWATASSNIQAAVNSAAIGDTIWMAPGRYTVPENPTNYFGTNVVFVGKPMALRGSTGNPDDVIIDGEGQYRGVVLTYMNPVTNTFMLDGVTISNCVATNRGGGLLVAPHGWTLTIQNCKVVDNKVLGGSANTAQGGGMHALFNATGAFVCQMSNTVFQGNQAITTTGVSNGIGGAVYFGTCMPGGGLFVDCRFEGNFASAGGGLYHPSAGVTATNQFLRCVIQGNTAQYNIDAAHGGGGLMLYGGYARMRNCLVVSNLSESYGGAANIQSSSAGSSRLILENCTLVSNRYIGVPTVSASGGLSARRTNDIFQVQNSIIHGNQASGARNPDVAQGGTVVSSPAFFSNSCFSTTNGLFNYTGIVTNNPLFEDGTAGNFRLTLGSPCRNTGIVQDWMDGETDLDGRRRVDVRTHLVDMGAYEFPLYGNGAVMLVR